MKFLVFIVLVVGSWYLLRWAQQAEAARRILRDQQRRRDGRGGWRQGPGMRTTDTTICSRCGAYVPTEFPVSCGRNDCPYPGIG